jgi:hypothetical protein
VKGNLNKRSVEFVHREDRQRRNQWPDSRAFLVQLGDREPGSAHCLADADHEPDLINWTVSTLVRISSPVQGDRYPCLETLADRVGAQSLIVDGVKVDVLILKERGLVHRVPPPPPVCDRITPG